MPEAKDLFERAISQSGGFEFLPRPEREDAATGFDKLAAALEETLAWAKKSHVLA